MLHDSQVKGNHKELKGDHKGPKEKRVLAGYAEEGRRYGAEKKGKDLPQVCNPTAVRHPRLDRGQEWIPELRYNDGFVYEWLPPFVVI